MKTYLIAIEGIDGSGKATQAKKLAERINAQVFSFPAYDTDTGKALASHLKGEWACYDGPPRRETSSGYGLLTTRDMMVRQSLMTVNRYEMMHKIDEALQSGHVICDRWWLSSLAYGAVEGLDRKWVISISDALYQPDLWILIDVPGSVGGGRRMARDKNERDIPKLERVRQQYIEEINHIQAGTGGHRMRGNAVIVDGQQSVDAIHKQICDYASNIPTQLGDGVRLFTKDGRFTGNAKIVRYDMGVFDVVTDYGNHAEMTEPEIRAYYYIEGEDGELKRLIDSTASCESKGYPHDWEHDGKGGMVCLRCNNSACAFDPAGEGPLANVCKRCGFGKASHKS